MTYGVWRPERVGLSERALPPRRTERFLAGRLWIIVVVLFAIFAVLEPYDLLSPISGYGLQEHRAEIGAALDTIESGSMTRRLGVLALCLVGVVAWLVSRHTSRRYNPAVAVPAVALLLLAVASPMWSDDPLITARKIFVLSALVLCAVGLARCWTLDTIVRVALVLSGMCIALGVAAEVVLGTMHPLRPEYRFRGLVHPNSMSLYCALFVLSSTVLAKQFSGRRSAIMTMMSAIGMGLLLLTKSRGTIIGLCAALVVLFVLSANSRTTLLAISASGVVVLGVVIAFPDLSTAARLWATLGRADTADLLTMTGRTDLFHDLLQYAAARPFLGYGYDSFWGPVHILEIARSQGWIVGSSHNQYIGMLLDLGVVGGSLFLVFLGSCLLASVIAFRRHGDALSLFPIALLVWSSINMITYGFWFESTIPALLALMVVARLAIRDGRE